MATTRRDENLERAKKSLLGAAQCLMQAAREELHLDNERLKPAQQLLDCAADLEEMHRRLVKVFG